MRWSSFEGGMLAILYTLDPTYELDIFGAFDRVWRGVRPDFSGVERGSNKPQDLPHNQWYSSSSSHADDD